MDRDLLGLHREVHTIAWRQSQLGRGFGGDVRGQARPPVGLLVGTHPDDGTAAVEVGDRPLNGVTGAAVRFVAVDGDRPWREQGYRRLASHEVGPRASVPGGAP